MNIGILLQMAAEGLGDRIAIGDRTSGMTYSELYDQARASAAWIARAEGESLVLVDVNSEAVPSLVFGAAFAGKRFVPVNYRLADAKLRAIVARTAPCTVVVNDDTGERVSGIPDVTVINRFSLDVGSAASGAPEHVEELAPTDPQAIAVLLFTSGTTAEPKAAVLRHQNLFSYIVGTVEFMGAEADECTLISVPIYHIAGTAAVLSSVYAGRRLVYLEQFDPAEWVRLAREQCVTHAMVVPTMLGRILDVLDGDGESLPALTHLSYGGGRMPRDVVERALELLPHVDFVNAYGLTETSSTVAMLTPADHREAARSADPAAQLRLTSVGRPLPSIELEIRDLDHQPVPAGTAGEVWVRGEQVAGEYLGSGEQLHNGWFPTRDGGWLDSEGYLFLDGRIDDIIVRGGENMSPVEIEQVLCRHPSVADAAVFGLPDSEWGEKIAAVVVANPQHTVDPAALQEWVRGNLRSSHVPSVVEGRDSLPYTETGKLLRRTLKDQLLDSDADARIG